MAVDGVCVYQSLAAKSETCFVDFLLLLRRDGLALTVIPGADRVLS